MKQYIRNFENFVLNEQNYRCDPDWAGYDPEECKQSNITSSEYDKAIDELNRIWEPIHKQWMGKTVNFYTQRGGSSNSLLGRFKIQTVGPKYTAGKEELRPFVVIQLGNGSIYAYESDLQKNSFKVGKRGLGDLRSGAIVTNKGLAKSILTKWPQIEELAGRLSNIKNKQRVPDADFTASINKDLGGDDMQLGNAPGPRNTSSITNKPQVRSGLQIEVS